MTFLRRNFLEEEEKKHNQEIKNLENKRRVLGEEEYQKRSHDIVQEYRQRVVDLQK